MKGSNFMKFKIRNIILFFCVVLILYSNLVFAGKNKEDFAKKNINCSDWAKNEIAKAIEIGLIPNEMQKDYISPITREEFCILIINMLGAVNNNILKYYDNDNIFYIDTDNDSVISASGLGIVSGIENDKFNPGGSITRQEASRMLYMTSTLGEKHSEINDYLTEKVSDMNNNVIMPHIFRDGNKIQSWAQESINYCYMYGIMQGIDNNQFDVNGTYSREQAYITILRLYNLYKNGEINIPEKNYIYRKKENKDGLESWGYINEKNQWVIKTDSFDSPLYDAGEFDGNYAMVDMGDASGLRVINQKGDVVFGGFRHGTKFGDIASFENSEGTVNLNTKDIIGEESWLKGLQSGLGETLVAVRDKDTKLYGYYNAEGNLIIAKKYEEAYPFCNGKAIVKEEDKYKLIDRFGSVITDINILLEKGEFISDAMGDILVISKKGEYQNEYCYLFKVGKDKIIVNSDNSIENVKIFNSGDIDICKFDENYTFVHFLYNNDGKEIFRESDKTIVNISYNNYSNLYLIEYYDDSNSVINRQGKILVDTKDSDKPYGNAKFSNIGNNTFCVWDNKKIKIYDATGKVLNEINIENNIEDIYSDNGIIFIIDVNNSFYGYTYLGKRII